MTIENDYLVFANTSSNIESQSTYAADAALPAGETADTVASSSRYNKVARQATSIAAMIAAFVVQQGGLSMVDNGSITANLANFIQTLSGSCSLIGAASNAFMQVTAGASSATFTADEVIVGKALGGFTWKLGNFNNTINLTTTGAGGMDTGSSPSNSYVGIYAIYNITTQSAALLAVATGSGVLPSVYGGSAMPAGYGPSGLVAVLPTNSAGYLKFGLWMGRTWFGNQLNALNSPAVVSTPTAISLASIIPPNAKSIDGLVLVSSSNGSNSAITLQAQTTGNANKQMGLIGTAAFTKSDSFTNQPIIVGSQTIYYTSVGSGSPNYQLIVTGYTI
jgi:hypothetical protein